MLHTDGLLSVFCGLENNSPRSLRASIRTNVDVGTDDITRRTEQILQILPASLVGQLRRTNNQTCATRAMT